MNNINRINSIHSEATVIPNAVPAVIGTQIGWRDAVDEYLAGKDVGSKETKKTYRKALIRFFTWVEYENLAIEMLTNKDIINYKNYLLSVRHCSSLTVSTYVCALRGFYRWAEAGRISPNIARDIQTSHDNEHVRMHLTQPQISRLLECAQAMGPREYAMINLMLRCGLRTIEASRADIKDISYLEDQRIMYIQGKGRKDKKRWVVLRDAAYIPIREYLDTRKDALPSAPLFVGQGKGSTGRRLSTRTIQDICKRCLRGIGLDSHEYTAHSLRHTTGVQIIKNGGTVADVQDVLGHASIDTSRIYLKSASIDIRLANPAERFLDNIG